MKIVVFFGTRPELIKLFSIIQQCKDSKEIELIICNTGQHKEMLTDLLNFFNVKPNYDLSAMKGNQSLSSLTSRLLLKIDNLLIKEKPDLAIVHGDTTTSMSAALSCFYNNVKVCHIEAGLRTSSIKSPWPEEMNRRFNTLITDLHFAPTKLASTNLIKEGVHKNRIIITGNTVIDALLFTKKNIDQDAKLSKSLEKKFNFLSKTKKTLLITGHRRENFDSGLQNLCIALKKILGERDDIQIVFPVHLNPNVRKIIKNELSDLDNIYLLEPQNYLNFIYLFSNCFLILTDSGGIQEEAPSLGKPTLILRNETERPEVVEAGCAKIVGTSVNKIVKSVISLLEDPKLYEQMSKVKNPFGDGNSGELIVKKLIEESNNA